MKVPEPRIRDALDRTVRPERTWILYWMTSARRPTYNFALQRAVELAKELNKPLLVFEAVRAAYGHASDRLHRFLLQGMADNHDAFAGRGVGYLPYVEPEPDAGKGLLRALGSRACAVVTDDHPGFFLPKMLEAASNQLDVRMEAVDSNGVLPIERERAYLRAVDFRRHVQRTLPTAFVLPAPDPLEGVQLPPAPVLDEALLHRWPPATASSLREGDLSSLPIDHTVGPVGMRGGAAAARDRLERFVAERLDRYAAESNHPDARATSGLAPYLHFGHIATHEVFDAVAHRERWSMDRVADRAAGQRAGWWGMSEAAERFVDQLVTWRELGFSTAARRPDHREFGSLPPWARQTLADHVGDPRPIGMRSRPSPVHRPTTRSGTLPSASWSATVQSTATFACSGARRS